MCKYAEATPIKLNPVVLLLLAVGSWQLLHNSQFSNPVQNKPPENYVTSRGKSTKTLAFNYLTIATIIIINSSRNTLVRAHTIVRALFCNLCCYCETGSTHFHSFCPALLPLCSPSQSPSRYALCAFHKTCLRRPLCPHLLTATL